MENENTIVTTAICETRRKCYSMFSCAKLSEHSDGVYRQCGLLGGELAAGLWAPPGVAMASAAFALCLIRQSYNPCHHSLRPDLNLSYAGLRSQTAPSVCDLLRMQPTSGYIGSQRGSYLTRLFRCRHIFIFAYHIDVSSSKCNRVDDDQEVEEDQRYFNTVSFTAYHLYSPYVILTPHQSSH